MFREDGALYKLMWTVADMFVVNFLWLLFCIPVITIGASTAAAIDVNMRIVRKEESYIWKNFWESFRKNFVDGTKLFAVLAVLLYFFYINIQYFIINQSVFHLVIITMSAVFALLAFIYAFPLAVRYENTTRRTMINSIFFSLKWPGMLIITLVQVGLLAFAYVFFTMILVFDDPGTGMGMFSMFVVVLVPEMILITLAYRGNKVIEAYKKFEGIEEEDPDGISGDDM